MSSFEEKVTAAVEADLRGASKPLEMLIDTGSDALWEKLLGYSILNNKAVERIYASKRANQLDISGVIQHPNITPRLEKHIVKMQIQSELDLILNEREQIRYQGWFLEEILKNPAARLALNTLAQSPNLEPSDVSGLSANVAFCYITPRTNPYALCQILFDHKDNDKVRRAAFKVIYSLRDSIRLNQLVNAALMDSMAYETDDELRRDYTILLKKITPQDFY